MITPASEASSTPPSQPEALSTVRYSLPELLAELALERADGSFAMEKLQQNEIGKLFQTQPRTRRVKPAN
jgi:hypothetical protein